MTSLVLTFAGPDRPGLVNMIAEKISAAGGSWLESRLARLAGEFAGIVLIRVEEAQRPHLAACLRELDGLSVTVTPSGGGGMAERSALTLELVGHDRPGIVRDVTQALTRLGVNIEEFSSAIESAPFTGEELFRAVLTLGLPASITAEAVRHSLEDLAQEIMVDVREEDALSGR